LIISIILFSLIGFVAAMKFKATEAFVEIKVCKMAALMSFFCGNLRRHSLGHNYTLIKTKQQIGIFTFSP
jgi:azurin